MKVFYILCISVLIEITPHHNHILQHNTSILRNWNYKHIYRAPQEIKIIQCQGSGKLSFASSNSSSGDEFLFCRTFFGNEGDSLIASSSCWVMLGGSTSKFQQPLTILK